ncbi:uncharacterized protein B0H64DRAFT_381607 [Chaetomium fimeti]|uniref:Uncharacterized protein n=1 Tax=Chaetomium fimeti TaxID=1854472 RepID=A0AAE0HQ69_9PEZI|nr:hypothetical protein B0H64DRAFT_381607 [Chaetomium fimeti]
MIALTNNNSDLPLQAKELPQRRPEGPMTAHQRNNNSPAGSTAAPKKMLASQGKQGGQSANPEERAARLSGPPRGVKQRKTPESGMDANWELLDNPNDPVLAEKRRKENEAMNKLIDDLDDQFAMDAAGRWKR